MTNSDHIHSDPRTEALAHVPAEEKDALGKMWDLAASAEDTPAFSKQQIEETRQRLLNVARSAPTIHAPDRLPLKRTASRRTWMVIAATLLLGALGIGWWLQPVVVTAPFGEQVAVNLPDGSGILLNSGSRLTYPRSFNASREVYLEGEGFFEVTPSSVPFVLTTFNASVEVLGTKFNVKAWQQSFAPQTTVTLTEGSVLFSPTLEQARGVILKPGETRRLSGNDVSISPADTVIHRARLAWKAGDLVYQDEPVGVILEDIQRHFAVAIDLQARDVLQREYTFVYRQPASVYEVISSLCDGLGLRYRRTNAGVALYPDN